MILPHYIQIIDHVEVTVITEVRTIKDGTTGKGKEKESLQVKQPIWTQKLEEYQLSRLQSLPLQS